MRTITLVACSFLICAVSWAQTSQIIGTVRDPAGLAIPGAAIKVTQTATGVSAPWSAQQMAATSFDLPIGPYLLEVAREGFDKYAQKGIVLQVDTNPTIDVSLQVGSVSEQVTVEANAVQVETRTSSIGQVVTNQQIAEMPLNGRNPIELVFLAGMANFPGNGNINTVRNYPTVVVPLPAARATAWGICWTARSPGPLQQPGPSAAVPGRLAGVQSGDQRGAGPVWVSRDCGGERRHEIRHE